MLSFHGSRWAYRSPGRRRRWGWGPPARPLAASSAMSHRSGKDSCALYATGFLATTAVLLLFLLSARLSASTSTSVTVTQGLTSSLTSATVTPKAIRILGCHDWASLVVGCASCFGSFCRMRVQSPRRGEAVTFWVSCRLRRACGWDRSRGVACWWGLAAPCRRLVGGRSRCVARRRALGCVSGGASRAAPRPRAAWRVLGASDSL